MDETYVVEHLVARFEALGCEEFFEGLLFLAFGLVSKKHRMNSIIHSPIDVAELMLACTSCADCDIKCSAC